MPNSPKGLHQQKYYEKEGAAASFFLKIQFQFPFGTDDRKLIIEISQVFTIHIDAGILVVDADGDGLVIGDDMGIVLRMGANAGDADGPQTAVDDRTASRTVVRGGADRRGDDDRIASDLVESSFIDIDRKIGGLAEVGLGNDDIIQRFIDLAVVFYLQEGTFLRFAG